MTAPNPEGDWIEWAGGENPVPGKRVRCRYSDGSTDDGDWPSEEVAWGKGPDGEPYFVAFRLAAPAALQPSPAAPSDDEEAYQIGKRDGYESAVQDIDLLTGGDGEYFAATIPSEGCPDAATMKARIVERFEALQPSPAALDVCNVCHGSGWERQPDSKGGEAVFPCTACLPDEGAVSKPVRELTMSERCERTFNPNWRDPR